MKLLNVDRVKETITVSKEEKKVFLEMLGFSISDKGNLMKDNKLHVCPITKQPLSLDRAAIVPGSTLVIDDSVVSFADYFAQHYKILC